MAPNPREPICIYAMRASVCNKLFYGRPDRGSLPVGPLYVKPAHVSEGIRRAELLWGQARMDWRSPIFVLRDMAGASSLNMIEARSDREAEA